MRFQLRLILTLIVIGPLSLSLQAQQSFTLNQAIQTALQNNDGVKSSELQIEYFRLAKKGATDIGKFSANWMHGQYNSQYQDNNFTFTQSIPFPTVLTGEVQLGKERISGAQKGLRASQNDLIHEVKSTYYQLLYVEALRSLLFTQDSLYIDFSKATSLRFKTGESNLLEMTTAETQRMEVNNQSRLNLADIDIVTSRLKTLLKASGPIAITGILEKRMLPAGVDSISLRDNPQLAYLTQQTIIGQRARRLEKNRIFPDINVGYFNQSLIGVQNINGQDVFFGRGKQFQGFTLGVSFPLWVAPSIARVRAAGFTEAILRKNAEQYQARLKGSFEQTLKELEKNRGSLEYYELSALKNADLLLAQSKKAFTGGEIGNLEYLQALKAAIIIKSNYLNSLNQYNQSVIQLEYLLGNLN